jgi:competence CoiA-like predicted nuclease
MLTAEMKKGKGWHQVDTDAAKVLRDNPMRCEACHGPVYLMQDYTRERRTKFTHRRQFVACGKSSHGIPMRHPAALD